MSLKQLALASVPLALLLLGTSCVHHLEVLNLADYQVPGRIDLPKRTTIGVIEDGTDASQTPLINGITTSLQNSGAQVVNPYRPNLDNPVDVVLKIAIKAEYDGSGTNFWINFPGFLIWTPAWNGYVYKANFETHVELFKGSDLATAIRTIDVPVHLDLRHAEMDRTWSEISWFEVGAIALVTGLIYTRYDTDVTPLLMQEIERPIGEYVARKILQVLPAQGAPAP